MSPSISKNNKNEKIEPVFAGFGHIGTATQVRNYEDRYFCGTIKTGSGIWITLAIVSDGVGGGQLGQRAAQLTVDSIVDYCKSSSELVIPNLLGKAIGYANQKVYQEGSAFDDRKTMSATVAVAAVHEKRLFIANVGDSRIYLVRNSKQVIQITIDHTWALERIREGKLTKEEANRHPSAGALTRSIGYHDTIQVDLGIYYDGDDIDYKTAFSRQGLLLNSDDVILVCSDGLIKTQYSGNGNYVEKNEILATVSRLSAEKAVKMLVDVAVEKNVDDNVTAVIVEFSGKSRPLFKLPQFQMTRMAFLVIIVSLLVFIGVGLVVVPEIIPEPIPPTPHAGHIYLINGKLEHQLEGQKPSAFLQGSSFPFVPGSILNISEKLVSLNLPGGYRIFSLGKLESHSIIELLQAGDVGNSGQTLLDLLEGSLLLIDDYPDDRSMETTITTRAGRATLLGSMMGVRFTSEKLLMEVDCILGLCTVEADLYPIIRLQQGQRTVIRAGDAPAPASPVNLDLYKDYPLDKLLPEDMK